MLPKSQQARSGRWRLPSRALLGLGLLAGTQCAIPEFHHPEGEDGSDLGGLGGEDGATGGASSESGGTTATGGSETGGTDGSGGADDTGGSGGAATGGSGGTPATPCGSNGICTPPVPPDWSGPVALGITGADNTLTCAGTAYDSNVLSKFGELDEGTPTCDCECSDPSGMSCASLELLRFTDEINCGQGFVAETYTNQAMGSCISVPASSYYQARSNFLSGSCTPEPDFDIDEPQWSVKMVACEGDPIEGTCSDDDLCMPALESPLTAVCIYRDGDDEPCPSGPYSVQSTFYGDYTEGRSCTSCTCGAATGTCSGTVELSNTCGGLTWLGDATTGGSCLQPASTGNVGATFLTAAGTLQGGSCPPQGGELTGSVTKTEPVTVCCLP